MSDTARAGGAAHQAHPARLHAAGPGSFPWSPARSTVSETGREVTPF